MRWRLRESTCKSCPTASSQSRPPDKTPQPFKNFEDAGSRSSQARFRSACTMKTVSFLLVLLGSLSWSAADHFPLTVLHTNDVHARYMQASAQGGRCTPKLRDKNQCYGGIPRQQTKIKEIRQTDPNVLLLNAGDNYQGTLWYNVHKWNITAEFMNMLQYDAMSFGNHEFDDDLPGLLPFLERVNFPVLAANLDASDEPEMQGKFQPSVVLEVGDQKIGVIGYITTETKTLARAGNLKFFSEVKSIEREAKKLESEGVNKIIAVGHAGFPKDLEIAKQVHEVDIVVGGHTNTFLYTGDPPSIEEPVDVYPVVVERYDGSKSLVVQDYAFGKYMGHLQVTFDEDGHLTNWSGNPILLDHTVPQDQEVLSLLQLYEVAVEKTRDAPVGTTNVLLQGDRFVCRLYECNLGNMLADACLQFYIKSPASRSGWNPVGVAVWNAGGIRSSISEQDSDGNVTLGDVMSVAPFRNTIEVVTMRGKGLRRMMEDAVITYDTASQDPDGQFLQISGMKVSYDVQRPPTQRVSDLQVKCTDCRIPEYRPLQDEDVYQVVMPTYLAEGREKKPTGKEDIISRSNAGDLDIDIVARYIRHMSPIIAGIEGRIFFVNSTVTNCDAPEGTANKNPGTQSDGSSEEAGTPIHAKTIVDSLVPAQIRRLIN